MAEHLDRLGASDSGVLCAWFIAAPVQGALLTVHVQKDYHLIVPNLRGFGKSGFVGNVETTGTFFDIAGDVNCLLQAEKVAQATCVGCVRSCEQGGFSSLSPF